MSGPSKIQWTEQTWNPVVGCSIHSPGCTNCYAMSMARRIEAMNEALQAEGKSGAAHYAGTTKVVNGNPVWTGKLALAPEHILLEPYRRRKPTTYFVNSMGDLFHEDAPDDWIDEVFAIMGRCDDGDRGHTFQVLTKRAQRMHDYMNSPRAHKAWNGHRLGTEAWPPRNVWLGVSAERQKEGEERIPLLLQTPAAVRFVSAEPLIGPLDLMMLKTGDRVYDALQGCIGTSVGDGEYDGGQPCPKLDWVIVGGESGKGARPMSPAWAKLLRDECDASGVPFFFKQWGEWAPHKVEAGGDLGGDVRAGRVTIVHPSGRDEVELLRESDGRRQTEKGSRYMARVGKKKSGRLLDGREWNEFPKAA
jgi:protein gp37